MTICRIILTACYVLLFSSTVLCVSARQVQAESPWTIYKGDSSVDTSNNTIHIAQITSTHTTRYALVTQSLSLPLDKPWKISFDFKFGQLRPAGCGITMSLDTSQICWVGGDQFYKSMVTGVDQTLIYQQLADGEWHKFSFSSDCKTISIDLDGRKVGSAVETATPNAIKLGSFVDKQAIPGEQTEIWVRDVKVSSGTLSDTRSKEHTTSQTTYDPVMAFNNSHTIAKIPGDTSHKKEGEINLDNIHREFAIKDATIALLRQRLVLKNTQHYSSSYRHHKASKLEIVQNQNGKQLQTAAEQQITVQVQVTAPQIATPASASAQLADYVRRYNYLLSQVQALMQDEDICLDKSQRCLDWLDINEYADYSLRFSILVAGEKILDRSKVDDNAIQADLMDALSLWHTIQSNNTFATYYREGNLCTSNRYVHADLCVQEADQLRFVIGM